MMKIKMMKKTMMMIFVCQLAGLSLMFVEGREFIDLRNDAIIYSQDKVMDETIIDIVRDKSYLVDTQNHIERQSGVLVLKVFVVVDWSIFDRFLRLEEKDVTTTIGNIRYYYAHVINGINDKYKSIDTGSYRYKVSLTGYYIMQTKEQSQFSEVSDVKTTNPLIIKFDTALKYLVKWVESNSNIIPSIGLVAAFTIYKDPTANGMAYLAKACTSGGVSISQSSGFQITVNIAAHEIGHNLGAEHDGPTNDCKETDYYLMTPIQVVAAISNYNTFSSCSRNYFEKYINSLSSSVKEKCFKEELNPMDEEVKKYLKDLPGLRYTPDDICRQSSGPDSFYCTPGAYAHEEICTENLPCYSKDGDGCYVSPESPGLDGTSCGNKSWCFHKQCVFDERAPAVNEYCMFGESRDKITFNNKKYVCDDLNKQKVLCYYSFFEEFCCKTCANLRNNGSEECKYGDKQQRLIYGGKNVTCEDFKTTNLLCYIESFRKICCQTCSEIESKYNDPNCKYGDNGSWCPSRVAGNPSECQTNPKITTACCFSCKGGLNSVETLNSNQIDCQDVESDDLLSFGNHIQSCSDLSDNPHFCYEDSYASKCCETCDILKTSNSGCEFGDKSPYCSSYMDQGGPEICKSNDDVKEQCCQTCSTNID